MEQQILSKRGKEKFCHDGYLYRFDKLSKSVDTLKFWRCHEERICKARIHTLNGIVVKIINDHTHPPSAVDIQVEKAKTEARLRAENLRTSEHDYQQMFRKYLSGWHDAIA